MRGPLCEGWKCRVLASTMRPSLVRLRRLLAVLLLASVALVAAGSQAAELPTGWQLDSNRLTWASATPLRIGGARYEFRSGTRLLGYPFQKANGLTLLITPGEPLNELSVWAAGRRIDASATERIAASAVLPFEPAISIAVFEPGTPGRFQTQRLHYQLAGLEVPDYPAPIEVVAEVTAPVGRHTPMPLVLFLHGRHSTCYRGGPDGEASGDWPCPEGWRPVPSHTGYRYIADVLASQGYLIVSIAANGINGQDGIFIDGGASARSELVRHHLAQLAEWSTVGGDPWGGRFHAIPLVPERSTSALVERIRGG